MITLAEHLIFMIMITVLCCTLTIFAIMLLRKINRLESIVEEYQKDNGGFGRVVKYVDNKGNRK